MCDIHDDGQLLTLYVVPALPSTTAKSIAAARVLVDQLSWFLLLYWLQYACFDRISLVACCVVFSCSASCCMTIQLPALTFYTAKLGRSTFHFVAPFQIVGNVVQGIAIDEAVAAVAAATSANVHGALPTVV